MWKAGQFVIPVAAPDDRRGGVDVCDCIGSPGALVVADPRQVPATVPPGQHRGGDAETVYFRESGCAVRIRERKQRVVSGRDSGPPSPGQHLAFGSVGGHSRDLDRVEHLGQEEDVCAKGPEQPVVSWRPFAFEVPRRDPHAWSLTYSLGCSRGISRCAVGPSWMDACLRRLPRFGAAVGSARSRRRFG